CGGGQACIRTFDLVGKRRIDREIPLAGESEKAHGQVGVVGGERGIDLARRNRGVERVRDRVIGERHPIVLGSEQKLRLRGARRPARQARRQWRAQVAQRYAPRSQNRSPAPPAPISSSAVAPARDHGEKLPIGHGGGTQGPSWSSEKPRSVRRLGRLA